MDSVSEKDSERSIKKPTNDIFIEINEKISACFNTNGFAIHIKVNGLIFVKNYIIRKINCNIMFNESFAVSDETMMSRIQLGSQQNGSQFNQYNGNMNNRNKVRITQIQETVDYDRLTNNRTLNF